MRTVTRTTTHVITHRRDDLATHAGQQRVATIVEPFTRHPLALICGRLFELREIKD